MDVRAGQARILTGATSRLRTRPRPPDCRPLRDHRAEPDAGAGRGHDGRRREMRPGSLVRTRLPAGGSGIRTLGPAGRRRWFSFEFSGSIPSLDGHTVRTPLVPPKHLADDAT